MHHIHHQVYKFIYSCTWITWVTWVWTQDFMEASKCFRHQVTQLFIGKACATFSFILLIMKQFGNPNFDILVFFFQMKQIYHNFVAYSKMPHAFEFKWFKKWPNWINFTHVNKCKIKFSLFNVKQVEKMNHFGYYKIKWIEIKLH
jgi:hypothetical protein